MKKGFRGYVIQAPRGVKIKVVARKLKVKKTRAEVEPRVGFRPICEHGLEARDEGKPE